MKASRILAALVPLDMVVGLAGPATAGAATVLERAPYRRPFNLADKT